MAKQQTPQRHIYKISSTRLRKSKWKLELSIRDAKKGNEVIPLADSTILRFIDEFNGCQDNDSKIEYAKIELKQALKQGRNTKNKNKIKKLLAEIEELSFKKDYVFVTMDSKTDYRYLYKHGFLINGIKYKRLLGTTNQVKQNTIVFVSEHIKPFLRERLDNGRDKSVPMTPAKFGAYESLACSSSVPVTQPKGILVVPDCFTEFVEDVIELDDSCIGEPSMKLIKDMKIRKDVTDGFGMVLPSTAEQWSKDLNLDYIPSGFNTRYSFEKGMLVTFDFLDFSEKIAKNHIVIDVWGNEIDIRTIDVVLTESMLKLWDSYKNIDDYIDNCNKNNYKFSIPKYTPKTLENERCLNYQFIQSYDLTDEEIQELVQPTIDEIHGILGGDYRKTLVYSLGKHLNENNIGYIDRNEFKSIMADKNMMNDPYVFNTIHTMIKNRIDEAKVGVIKVSGNYQIACGDPYILCQSMFGLKPTGLLKKGELYSKYWIDKGSNVVACFRPPMTCHNNIRTLSIANTEEMSYWYKYITTMNIFNSWDTTMEAENGEDFDGDQNLTTDNHILVKNTRNLPTIMCVQRKAPKKVFTEDDLFTANMDSFGDDIGKYTNGITSQFEVQSKFSKDSEEYKVLDYRIACGQLFQQNAIDKTKGIIAKKRPSYWFDYRALKIDDEDTEEQIQAKEFNKSIVADRKPYFMIYVYPTKKTEYNKYFKDVNKNSLLRFGLSLNELKKQTIFTQEQEEFLMYFYKCMPVGTNPCIMNKICWIFENEFDSILKDFKLKNDFDKDILKSGIQYDKKLFREVKKLYEEYKKDLKTHMAFCKENNSSVENKKNILNNLQSYFYQECLKVCCNKEELTDILIDVCYTSNTSKKFCWTICGEQIVENLLNKNNRILSFPTMSNDDIDFMYDGDGFKMSNYTIENTKESNEVA